MVIMVLMMVLLLMMMVIDAGCEDVVACDVGCYLGWHLAMALLMVMTIRLLTVVRVGIMAMVSATPIMLALVNIAVVVLVRWA